LAVIVDGEAIGDREFGIASRRTQARLRRHPARDGGARTGSNAQAARFAKIAAAQLRRTAASGPSRSVSGAPDVRPPRFRRRNMGARLLEKTACEGFPSL